ncbi:MAG: glycosyl transferase [Firmicutes bacterium]|nr:glycosyl transferase [Bacillota bacterium]
MIRVYTSITKSYIPKARVLAKSLKRFHPDWEFNVVFSDTLPLSFDLTKEPFDSVTLIDEFEIPDKEQWIFKHSIVELCTAVKGFMGERLCARPNTDAVIYLDPDIMIFNSLEPLIEMLDEYDILLTPHLTHNEGISDRNPEPIENELTALKYGVYNLGFYAVKPEGQGLEFVKWWSNRLHFFCDENWREGLFTDQKWCDIAPGLFSKLGIIHDPGYNTATWNLKYRPISKRKGIFYAGDKPLRFYHFTGYDSGKGLVQLKKVPSYKNAKKLWDIYDKELKANGHGDEDFNHWHYNYFNNGEKITKEMRRLFRAWDIQDNFKKPFHTEGNSFFNWFYSDNYKKNKENYSKFQLNDI